MDDFLLRHGANEIITLLGCYAAQFGKSVTDVSGHVAPILGGTDN